MSRFLNPYIEEYRSLSNKMINALKENNAENYNSIKIQLDEAYEKCKLYDMKMNSNKNFGMCNESFISVLPTLFKSNKKAVNEITNLIKEDKNLKSQYQFFTSLTNCSSEDTLSYLKESLSLLMSNIDTNTLDKSNAKLIKLVQKYQIVSESEISDDKVKLFENCDYLFRNKRNFNNLNVYTEKLSEVKKYIDNNKSLNEARINVFKLIEDFDKKYNTLLNEEEKSLLQTITDARKDYSSNQKEKFFNNLKNECIKGIETLMETSSVDEKSALAEIKKEVANKVFNEDTIVKDVAKLLELRDIIKEK